jgi:hypothetical protein
MEHFVVSEQLLIVAGGTVTALVTGITTYVARHQKKSMEKGIRPHLESLSERVSNIEGTLHSMEKTQNIILDRLLKRD